jgi:hypothetical protein
MKQYYRIAGLTVEMETFGRTLEQAAPYAISPVAEADVRIERRWQRFREQHPDLSEEACEYVFSGAEFYKHLISFDGLMLHSSAVVADGRAYLFAAPSGTGKSTHTALWLRELGERAFILNDDKPALRWEEGAFYAYGTPWSGKNDSSVNLRVPVGGICLLQRSERNEIVRISGKKAVLGIFAQTLRPQNEKYMDKVLGLIERLIKTVPIWELKCNMEPEAAQIAHRAMSGAQ